MVFSRHLSLVLCSLIRSTLFETPFTSTQVLNIRLTSSRLLLFLRDTSHRQKIKRLAFSPSKHFARHQQLFPARSAILKPDTPTSCILGAYNNSPFGTTSTSEKERELSAVVVVSTRTPILVFAKTTLTSPISFFLLAIFTHERSQRTNISSSRLN